MKRARSRGPISERRRSEEHTSELQSQSNLVCRLLLEKKKKITNSTKRTNELSPDYHTHSRDNGIVHSTRVRLQAQVNNAHVSTLHWCPLCTYVLPNPD